MPTDKERREVARRLREIRLCKSGHNEWWRIAQALGLKEPAGWFGWEKFEPDSVNRLADLIEPSCDRDALLKVADMLECDGECSECECGKGTFCEAPTIAAARIREALGVEHG